MASPREAQIEDQRQEESVHEAWQDLKLSEPMRSCLGSTTFLLITIVLLLDLATDIWVMAIFGMRGHMVLCGVAILILVANGLICAFMYAVQMKTEGTQHFCQMPGCLLLNVPFQLGIMGHRLRHFCLKAEKCCSVNDQINNVEWTFAKLKLAQSIFQSAPMMILNMYAMLVYWNVHDVHDTQYISAVVSFLSLVIGAVAHEKSRKERVRNIQVGIAQVTCIFVYKLLMLGARVIALANFFYFYRELIAAILVPHFLVIFAFFGYVYRAVWKVRYYKIFMHSIYCVLAYFPIHNEYRPEGEILIYYTIFIVENVIMVSLPYAIDPVIKVPKQHLPGSRYYYCVTIFVLVGSAIGLCFMAVYYFLLHKSKRTIRENHLSWLSRVCVWANKNEEHEPRAPAAQSPEANRLFVTEEEAANLQNSRQVRDIGVEQEHLLPDHSLDESGPPPSYRSALRGDERQARYVSPDSSRPSFSADDNDYKGTLSDIDAQSRPSLNTTRPSVLSGDDDMKDFDSDQDHDTRPLHVVV